MKASKGGVFDFQQVIYGAGEAEKYRSAMERSAPDQVQESRVQRQGVWTSSITTGGPSRYSWTISRYGSSSRRILPMPVFASVMRGKKFALAVSKTRKEGRGHLACGAAAADRRRAENDSHRTRRQGTKKVARKAA